MDTQSNNDSNDEVFQNDTESQENAIQETEHQIIHINDLLARKMTKCRAQQRDLQEEITSEIESKIADLTRMVKTNERRIARNHRYAVGNFKKYVGPSPDVAEASTQTWEGSITTISDQMDRRHRASVIQELWHTMRLQRNSGDKVENELRVNTQLDKMSVANCPTDSVESNAVYIAAATAIANQAKIAALIDSVESISKDVKYLLQKLDEYHHE